MKKNDLIRVSIKQNFSTTINETLWGLLRTYFVYWTSIFSSYLNKIYSPNLKLTIISQLLLLKIVVFLFKQDTWYY